MKQSNNLSSYHYNEAIQALRTNDKTITYLNLGAKGIGSEQAEEIAEALKVNRALTSLVLAANNIGDEGVAAIAEALKVNRALTSLVLTANNIGDEGVAAIAEALKVNRALTSLVLAANNIGDEGVAAIAEALKVNKTITNLHLGRCFIGPEGVAEIAEALKVNNTLAHLDLSFNKIGDKGAAAIAEVLKVNNTLTMLFISKAKIGDKGAAAIAEAFKINATLTSLVLWMNDISKDIDLEIGKLESRNQSICKEMDKKAEACLNMENVQIDSLSELEKQPLLQKIAKKLPEHLISLTQADLAEYFPDVAEEHRFATYIQVWSEILDEETIEEILRGYREEVVKPFVMKLIEAGYEKLGNIWGELNTLDAYCKDAEHNEKVIDGFQVNHEAVLYLVAIKNSAVNLKLGQELSFQVLAYIKSLGQKAHELLDANGDLVLDEQAIDLTGEDHMDTSDQ